MNLPATAEMLNLWEQGLTLSPLQRSLLLLSAVQPHKSWDDLARQSLGQRNAQLLTLRALLFGPTLNNIVSCPNCEEKLEFSLQVKELQQPTADTMVNSYTLTTEDFEIQYRLPTCADLFELATSPEAEKDLQKRCLIKIHQAGEGIAVDQLPSSVVEQVEQAMAEQDPLADTQMAMQCPTCEHEWRAGFDIAHYVWQEIQAWAGRILQEVHLLATAYHWSEHDILTMSTQRRQLYLKMVYG